MPAPSAYAPPASQAGRPAAIFWFRTYAAILALGCGGFGAFWHFDYLNQGAEKVPYVGVLILLFALPHAVAVAIPYKPWGWLYAYVLLWCGICSFLMPFAIALLVVWADPKTKAAFRRFL